MIGDKFIVLLLLFLSNNTCQQMSQINDTKCQELFLSPPEPAVATFVKTCNSKVNHPGHRFQEETFGDIEPQADHPSTTPFS